MENNNKHTIFLTVVALATLLIVVVGTTFAYFTSRVTTNGDDETQTVIKSATLGITYEAGAKVVLGTEEQGIFPGASTTNTFTVKNTGDYDSAVDISWKDLANDFAGSDLVYTLERTDEDGTNKVPVKGETVIPKTGENLLIANETIPTGKSYKYTLHITFKETNEDQSIDKGKTFDSKINVEIAENASTGHYTTPTE